MYSKRKMKPTSIICLIFIAVFLVSSVMASVAFAETQAGADSWPMFHGNLSHTGFSGSSAPAANATLWNFNTGSQVGSPTISGDIVYVGSYDHKIYAFNAADGAVVWNASTGGIVISRPP